MADATTVSCHIGSDHPAFDGHFPGQPLLPGALLLAEVMQALAAQPDLAAALGPLPSLSSAKFLAPVGPGSELSIEFRSDARGVDFEVRCGGTSVAKGRFAGGAPP